MTTVYTLWHVYEYEPGEEEQKALGVFSSEEEAQKAIAHLVKQPGFIDHPNGFRIYPNTLGTTWWVNGFVTDSIEEMQPSFDIDTI